MDWDLTTQLIKIIRSRYEHAILNMTPDGLWRIVAPIDPDDSWESDKIWKWIKEDKVYYLSGNYEDPDNAWKDAVQKHGNWEPGPILNYGTILSEEFVISIFGDMGWTPPVSSGKYIRINS